MRYNTTVLSFELRTNMHCLFYTITRNKPDPHGPGFQHFAHLTSWLLFSQTKTNSRCCFTSTLVAVRSFTSQTSPSKKSWPSVVNPQSFTDSQYFSTTFSWSLNPRLFHARNSRNNVAETKWYCTVHNYCIAVSLNNELQAKSSLSRSRS